MFCSSFLCLLDEKSKVRESNQKAKKCWIEKSVNVQTTALDEWVTHKNPMNYLSDCHLPCTHVAHTWKQIDNMEKTADTNTKTKANENEWWKNNWKKQFLAFFVVNLIRSAGKMIHFISKMRLNLEVWPLFGNSARSNATMMHNMLEAIYSKASDGKNWF